MSGLAAILPTARAAAVIERERAQHAAAAQHSPRSWGELAELRGCAVLVRAWGATFRGELVEVERESDGRRTRRVAIVWVREVGRHLEITDLRRVRSA